MDYHRTNLHSEFKCVCIYKDKFPYFCYILVVCKYLSDYAVTAYLVEKSMYLARKNSKKVFKKSNKKEKKKKKRKIFLTHLFFIFQIIIL
jgi:hypothetical protein